MSSRLIGGQRCFDQVRNMRGIGDIAGNEVRLAAIGADRARRRSTARHIAGGNHDLCTLGSQTSRALASPIPDEPPVMIATFPASLPMSTLLPRTLFYHKDHEDHETAIFPASLPMRTSFTTKITKIKKTTK